ncbi:hypothetical protein QAD02_016597 [Eretmocerus hayati]|uniref:Uncharacterized protein n=1 Tax=Eretmocerus hayati TaxID=131215 RepID=A0ACC2PBM0_9HYME|nr:hypothetical protein QAD02_016597 [Eretmocerus hayati]
MFVIFNAGEVEVSEPVTGTTNACWQIVIDKDPTHITSWESPVFDSKDLPGVGHQWKLNFCDRYLDAQLDSIFDILTLEHLGTVAEQDSRFVVKFRVYVFEMGSVGVKKYDDTKCETGSWDFLQRGSYSICVPTKSTNSFKLEVLCNIIVPQTHAMIHVNSPNQPEASLEDDYEHLFESESFSDVTVIVGKQELRLHKSILSSRSPVFSAMFDHNFKENISNQVHIEDQTYKATKEFFRYIYAAKVTNIDDLAMELLVLANKYGVEDLKNICEENLVKSLRNKNALHCLNLASHHNAKFLAAKCFKFVMSNAKEISKLQEFDISQLPRDVVNKFFKHLAEQS